ncbi:MAG TPA: MFS transporter [Candidatus Acidoferrales bacterium]|nr:MFS transporter [Candidatus Acidoferrales bacterium]
MAEPAATPSRTSATSANTSADHDGTYAAYVLAVLVVVYVFNFLDRQILSILAEHIKADLQLSDAQIGFLYGTAFAVFYALFGIPLGRLADVWDRRRLISIGLAFWSVMTAASALAHNFWQLSLARIGVGVGEASASPSAHSLLCDYFPPRRRATVLAIYSGGLYIGAGLGLGVGGLIVERWDNAFAGTDAPFGLRGWQVAFVVVGLPGLLLSLWVRTLREPKRGRYDGLPEVPPATSNPWRELSAELRAVIPPFALFHPALRTQPRQRAFNLAAAAGIAFIAYELTQLLGTPAQWIALGIGLYAATSWAQTLRARDPSAFNLIFQTPSLRYSALGYSLLAFTGYGLGFWFPPFFMRTHGVSPAQAGLILGGTAAVAGWLGTTLGGLWSDRWRQSNHAARLYVGMFTAILPLPIVAWMLLTGNTTLAYALNLPAGIATSLWIGPGASTVQDLVLPRMRAMASAAYLLIVTFIGLALGPYTIGRLSVALGDLRSAMLIGLAVNLIALAFLWLASLHLERDEATRLERSRS